MDGWIKREVLTGKSKKSTGVISFATFKLKVGPGKNHQ